MSNVFQMTTNVNGREYKGIKCGTWKALKLAGKMAPVITAAVMGRDITEALAGGDFLEEIAKDLLANISYDGKVIDGDTHFVTHPEDLLPVISWSAKEQVLPYFSAEAIQSISQALGLQAEETAE